MNTRTTLGLVLLVSALSACGPEPASYLVGQHVDVEAEIDATLFGIVRAVVNGNYIAAEAGIIDPLRFDASFDLTVHEGGEVTGYLTLIDNWRLIDSCAVPVTGLVEGEFMDIDRFQCRSLIFTNVTLATGPAAQGFAVQGASMEVWHEFDAPE